MRSWSKWVIFSRRTKSSSSVGPRAPLVSEFWLSEIAVPWLVVSVLSAEVVVWWSSPPLAAAWFLVRFDVFGLFHETIPSPDDRRRNR